MRRHPSRPEADLPPDLPFIHDYIRHAAALYPDRDALISETETLSYAEANDQVDQIAKALMAAGIEKGDRVATLLPPSPQFFLIFLATASIGAIWVGLNPKYSKRELAHPINDCTPKIILARFNIEDRDYADDLTSIASAANLIALGGNESSYNCFIKTGVSKISNEALIERRSTIHPADSCLIVYTSGTSGAPKGAMLTHQSLTYCGFTDAKYNLHTENQKILCNFPINHIACVGDVCCTTLVVGGTTVFMETFDPAGILSVINEHNITLLGQIPVMLHMTLTHPNFDPNKLASLKQIFWGGNPASIDLVKRLRALCPNLANVYGMTETTGNVIFARGGDFSDEDLAGTVGFAPPEYEVDLFDEYGEPVKYGQVGEIHVRGPFVMVGYWNNDAATREAFTADGWLRTGDLATRSKDGLVSVVGRRSEMFKSGGYNVYPAEVEQAIEVHEHVSMAAVVGVPDEKYFEVGHAYIIPTYPGLTSDDIRAHCQSLLANYKIPKEFMILPELPLLPNGKVDKKALKIQSGF